MKLIRVSLVNWYLFNPVDINIQGNTALIGVNGTGKSTILDAIQTVLFGANMNLIRFNAKASVSGGNNHRNLKSYCLGAYQSEGEDGEISTIRKDAESYIGLSFQEGEKVVNMFVAIEARFDEPKVDVKLLAIGRGDRPVSSEDFIIRKPDGTFTPIKISMIQEALHFKGFVFKMCHNSSEYIGEMTLEIGPDRASGESITPAILSKTLSKSLSIGEINGVSNFVKNFILEDRPLNVQSIINARNEYQQILDQIKEDERKLTELRPIDKKIKKALKLKRKSIAFQWHFFEEQIAAVELEIEKLEDKRNAEIDNYITNRTEVAKLTVEKGVLDSDIGSLSLFINSNDSKRLFSDLDRDVKAKESECDRLIRDRKSFLTMVAKYVSQDFTSLTLENQDQGVLNNISGLLVDLDKLNAKMLDKQLALLPDIVSNAKSVANDQSLSNQTHHTECVARLKDLYDSIESAKNGQLTLQLKTRLVMAALAREGVTATPVCQLATVTDKSWQPVIEAVLGGNTEALIVPPEDQVRAYKIYRNMRHEHGSKIYNVSIVRTDKTNLWLNKFQDNSAASLIESDNEHALAFLHNQLGNFIMVETEQELKQYQRAITVDGMVTTPAVTTRKSLPEILKLVLDQSDNISIWEREQQQLDSARILLEKAGPKIQEIYDSSVRFVSILQAASELTLEAVDGQISVLRVDIEEKKKQRDSIDLTSLDQKEKELESKKKELEHNGEKRDGLLTRRGKIRANRSQWLESIRTKRSNELPELQASRDAIVTAPEYDAQYIDTLNEEIEELTIDELKKKAESLFIDSGKRSGESVVQLKSYLADIEFFVDQGEEITIENIVRVSILVHNQLESIEKDSLAHHIESAQRAEREMNESFRSDMINKLKGAFDEMSHQLKTINNSLRKKQFHGKIYAFRAYEKTEFSDLIDYIKSVSEGDADNAGDMFDNTPEGIKDDIDKLLSGNSENVSIEDYREYYDYDVEVIDGKTDKKTRLSKMNSSASGGERQAPFYVTIASALASAWKTLKRPGESVGLTLLDEAFNNLSEDNLISAKDFMNEVGLQMIIAAPSDKEPVFRTVMDTFIYISREGEAVEIDVDTITQKGRNILIDANPNLNHDLVTEKLAQGVS